MVKALSNFSKMKMHQMRDLVTSSAVELHAIGLLYDSGNSFPDIVLSDKLKVLKIDEKLTNLSKNHLVAV